MGKAKLLEVQSRLGEPCRPSESACDRCHFLCGLHQGTCIPPGNGRAVNGTSSRDAWTPYRTLVRTKPTEGGIAYGPRGLWQRCGHSSQTWGRPRTGRRAAGWMADDREACVMHRSRNGRTASPREREVHLESHVHGKRACVVWEGAEGKGLATAPRPPPTSLEQRTKGSIASTRCWRRPTSSWGRSRVMWWARVGADAAGHRAGRV